MGCWNSGFEGNNFQNWETFLGVLNTGGGVNLSSLNQTYDPTQHQIVNANSIDPVGDFNMGDCGFRAAKIGDLAGGRKVSMIKYTVTITPQNANFSFRYAMVLQDPNHKANEQPFFQYLLLEGNRSNFTNVNQIITSKKFTSSANDPFFSNAGNGVLYKDWSTECINLSNYIGQEVSFLFLVGDCLLGGHGAYAYIDCLCENNDASANMTLNDNEFCMGDQIVMDGSASVNEDSYFVSIAESDQNWYVVPGTEKHKWFVAQQAGIVNINALASQIGFEFKCNKYYRIKLAVTNNCVQWDETVQLIYIRCPEDVGLGQDIVMCCNDIFPVVIEDENYNDHPSYTYNWTSDPIWSFMATVNDLHSYTYTPTQSTTFNVTVTDDYGCTLEDEINVILLQPFSVFVEVEDLGCCSYKLTPIITFESCPNTQINLEDPKWAALKHQMLNFQWSDSYNGSVRTVSFAQNTTLTLNVSSACFSDEISVNVQGCPELSGNFPRLTYPPSMESRSNSKNEWLVIHNPNLPINTPNAYKATGYRLEIVDRWGGVHKVAEDHGKCEGFVNGAIYWNGRLNNNPVQNGVYTFMLTLFNKTYPWDGGNTYIPFSNNQTPNGGVKNLDWYAYTCTSYGWNWWCFCNQCNSGAFTNHTRYYGMINNSN